MNNTHKMSVKAIYLIPAYQTEEDGVPLGAPSIVHLSPLWGVVSKLNCHEALEMRPAKRTPVNVCGKKLKSSMMKVFITISVDEFMHYIQKSPVPSFYSYDGVYFG